MIWTKKMIQSELQRLDGITGLKGARLPIHITAEKRTLGSFQHTKDGEPLRFSFSTYYLDDPEFSRAQAYDLIRHEYAHYMDVCRRGTSDHGPHWKACCQELGEDLDRCFSPLLNRFRLALERDEPLDSMLYELIPFLDDPEANQPKRRKKSAA